MPCVNRHPLGVTRGLHRAGSRKKDNAEQLVATVQEYDLSNILLAAETFNLDKVSPLDLGSLISCMEPSKAAQ